MKTLEKNESGDLSLAQEMHDHDDATDGWVRYGRDGKRVNGKPQSTLPPAEAPVKLPKGELASDAEMSALADQDQRKIDFNEDGNATTNDFADEDEAPPAQGEVFGDLSFPADEPPVDVVTSDPPPRTQEEQAFSSWLHSYPVHEGDREFEYMKDLGVKDVHEPKDDEEDHEQGAPADLRSQSEVAAPEPTAQRDYSYLDEWGGDQGQPGTSPPALPKRRS